MASRAKVRQVFDSFDTDGSGTVSTDELQRLIDACGLSISEEEVSQIMDEADADNSGEVDFDDGYVQSWPRPLRLELWQIEAEMKERKRKLLILLWMK